MPPQQVTPPRQVDAQAQYDLIDGWLTDHHNLNHPTNPKEFFAKYEWDFVVLKDAFLESLGVLIEDTYAKIRRCVQRLAGLKWQIPITFSDITKTQKHEFEKTWGNRANGWSKDRIVEVFILLRAEMVIMGHSLDNVERHEIWLENEWKAGTYHGGYRPGSMIPRRGGDPPVADRYKVPMPLGPATRERQASG